MLDDNLQFNFKLMVQELLRRGIELSFIKDTDIVEALYHGHKELLVNCDSSLTPSQYINILADKFYTKRFLEKKGIPTPVGKVFEPERLDLALFYAKSELKFPVVLKPTISDGGVFVFANIETTEDFILCFQDLKKSQVPSILVEKFIIESEEHRFFVTANHTVAVVKRTPPTITGDGKLSIGDLIEKENYKRMNPRNNCLCEIYVKDIEGVRVLTKLGYTLSSILEKDKTIALRNNSNVGFGGDCIDVTDTVHPSFNQLAKNLLALFPGLGFTGIDLLIKNATQAAEEGNYTVLELNHRPGFSLHTTPGEGQSRNVVKPLIDMLFPETVKQP